MIKLMYQDSDFPNLYWVWDGVAPWLGTVGGKFHQMRQRQLNEVAAYHYELEPSEWPFQSIELEAM